jgi:hypothetical protein
MSLTEGISRGMTGGKPYRTYTEEYKSEALKLPMGQGQERGSDRT